MVKKKKRRCFKTSKGIDWICTNLLLPEKDTEKRAQVLSYLKRVKDFNLISSVEEGKNLKDSKRKLYFLEETIEHWKNLILTKEAKLSALKNVTESNTNNTNNEGSMTTRNRTMSKAINFEQRVRASLPPDKLEKAGVFDLFIPVPQIEKIKANYSLLNNPLLNNPLFNNPLLTPLDTRLQTPPSPSATSSTVSPTTISCSEDLGSSPPIVITNPLISSLSARERRGLLC